MSTQTCVTCGEIIGDDPGFTYCPECYDKAYAGREELEPFQYHDGPDPLEEPHHEVACGEAETEDTENEEWIMDGHHCVVAQLPHQGYGQAVQACIEDVNGRLWMVDPSGRRQTQAQFCPQCGFQALEPTPCKNASQITPQDIALVTKDTPQAQWRVYGPGTCIKMSHFQFGSVRVLATNGCHAKVLTHDKVQMTVCVENLSAIAGIPTIPKIGEKPERKAGKREVKIDLEMLDKYMNMGLD